MRFGCETYFLFAFDASFPFFLEKEAFVFLGRFFPARPRLFAREIESE
jgi:hypothetical protein